MQFEILCGLTIAIACFLAIYFLRASPEKPKLVTPRTPTKASSTSTSPGGKTPLQRKVRALQKKIKDVENLMQLSDKELDKDQKKKKKSLRVIKRQLSDAETALQAEDKERQLMEEGEQREKEQAKKKAKRYLKVKWDDRFQCPICCEVLEAATLIEGCQHAFCRVCVLSLVDATKPGKKTLCPMCRIPFEPPSLKAASTLRKKMSKRTGHCHCGEEIALSKLRNHLRYCGTDETEIHDDEKMQQKYHVNQPLSLQKSPALGARSDWVNAEMEELVLQRVSIVLIHTYINRHLYSNELNNFRSWKKVARSTSGTLKILEATHIEEACLLYILAMQCSV